MTIDNTWIYYPEQCIYCKNNTGSCGYYRGTQAAIEALQWLDRNIKAYGSYQFKCDYFIMDMDKYHKELYKNYTMEAMCGD